MFVQIVIVVPVTDEKCWKVIVEHPFTGFFEHTVVTSKYSTTNIFQGCNVFFSIPNQKPVRWFCCCRSCCRCGGSCCGSSGGSSGGSCSRGCGGCSGGSSGGSCSRGCCAGNCSFEWIGVGVNNLEITSRNVVTIIEPQFDIFYIFCGKGPSDVTIS